jgi:hypothetical protein
VVAESVPVGPLHEINRRRVKGVILGHAVLPGAALMCEELGVRDAGVVRLRCGHRDVTPSI